MLLLVPLSVSKAGESTAVVGAVYGVSALFQLLSRPASGLIYRPERIRPLMLPSLVILALSNVGFALAADRWLFLILYALHGLAFGAITTFLLAVCIDVCPTHQKPGEVMGWFSASMSAGYMTGAFVAGGSAKWLGLEMSFVTVAALAMISVFILAFLQPSVSMPSVVPAMVSNTLPSSGGFQALSINWLRFLPRRPTLTVIMATLIAFYTNFLNDLMDSLFPVWALSIGLDTVLIGLVKGLKAFGSTSIRLGSGFLLRFVSTRTINIASITILAVAVAVIPLVGRLPLLLALVFLIQGCCRGIARVTSSTLIAEERGKSAKLGTASAWYNAGYDLGSIFGPLFGGLMASTIGTERVLVLIPIMLAPTYLAFELLLNRKVKLNRIS